VDLSDEGLLQFAGTIVKLWVALGKSPPSLEAEAEVARDIDRAFIAGMLSTIKTLYGSDELRKMRATIEGQVKAHLGHVPSLRLQSQEQFVAFLARAEVEWRPPSDEN